MDGELRGDQSYYCPRPFVFLATWAGLALALALQGMEAMSCSEKWELAFTPLLARPLPTTTQ